MGVDSASAPLEILGEWTLGVESPVAGQERGGRVFFGCRVKGGLLRKTRRQDFGCRSVYGRVRKKAHLP